MKKTLFNFLILMVLGFMVFGAVEGMVRINAHAQQARQHKLDDNPMIHVKVALTLYNGEEKLKSKTVTIKVGQTVMDALKKAYEVEASKNIIYKIDGRGAEQGENNYGWFYYVNKEEITTDANNYILTKNAKVNFDFHAGE